MIDRRVCAIGDSFLQQIGVIQSAEYTYHVGKCLVVLDAFTHADFSHHSVVRQVEYWRDNDAPDHIFGYEGLVWEAVSVLTLRRLFELAGVEEDAIAMLFCRYSTRVAELAIDDAYAMVRGRPTIMLMEVVRWIIPHFMLGCYPRGWTHDFLLL